MADFAAAFARCHDWALAPLSRDEAGLTILAYALGVALIVVPIALAVALFGTNVVSGADSAIDQAIHSVGQACGTAASEPNPFCS